MSIITQQKYQRQRMVKYARNHYVTETAINYRACQKPYINDWHGIMAPP